MTQKVETLGDAGPSNYLGTQWVTKLICRRPSPLQEPVRPQLSSCSEPAAANGYMNRAAFKLVGWATCDYFLQTFLLTGLVSDSDSDSLLRISLLFCSSAGSIHSA